MWILGILLFGLLLVGCDGVVKRVFLSIFIFLVWFVVVRSFLDKLFIGGFLLFDNFFNDVDIVVMSFLIGVDFVVNFFSCLVMVVLFLFCFMDFNFSVVRLLVYYCFFCFFICLLRRFGWIWYCFVFLIRFVSFLRKDGGVDVNYLFWDESDGFFSKFVGG